MPVYQSTNRWGCLGPGDVTWICFHVSSFLLKSLLLLLTPGQESPRLRWGKPWLCHRQEKRPPLATLTSMLSEAQLPYGTCRWWAWGGGAPSGCKSEKTKPVWPSRGDSTDWTVNQTLPASWPPSSLSGVQDKETLSFTGLNCPLLL